MVLTKISNITHWFGVLLLLLSAILLLITTISAPVISHISLLHVTLANRTYIRQSSVNYGTFGYCIMDVPPILSVQNWCTHSHVGYDASYPLATPGQSLPSLATDTSRTLSRVMVLHAIASGTTFIAFLVSLGGAHIMGSLGASLIAGLAWLFTVISIATDFSLFGVIRREVNDDAKTNNTGRKASFGAGIWCLVAAFVILSAAIVIVFFSCFGARREKKRTTAAGTADQPRRIKENDRPVASVRKKRFGLF